MQAIWSLAGQQADHPAIQRMREAALAQRPPRPKRRWAMPVGLAASVLLVTALGLVLSGRFGPFGGPAETQLATAVGQRLDQRLVDGSTVTLNTATRLTVRYDKQQRQVALMQGEAFFEVAKDQPAPFVVTANGVSVTAVGTAFSVRTLPAGAKIILLEGRIRVDTPGPGGAAAISTMLLPGNRLDFDGTRITVQRLDAEQSLGWRQGKLNFQATPLGEVAAEMNRYSQKQIVLGPGLATVPVTGTFRIGNPEGFLRTLEAAGLARVTQETADRVELKAPGGG